MTWARFQVLLASQDELVDSEVWAASALHAQRQVVDELAWDWSRVRRVLVRRLGEGCVLRGRESDGYQLR